MDGAAASLGAWQAAGRHGLRHIRQRLLFPLKSLHTDNGSEFINHTLYTWLRQEQVCFTRGRSYRKNDQAYVEQRNWLTVRRAVGYDRLASKQAYALLGQLYPLLCQQLNFFRPVRKLVAKERVGPHGLKRYDQPKTSYQRLLESDALKPYQRDALQRDDGREQPGRAAARHRSDPPRALTAGGARKRR